jgi:diguanylate cyclase (GGDEF)-like protein/PAS domain S-box-containing protein
MLSQQELVENERIKALHALGILDTPDEDRFDRFTRLAASAFGVPVALISLVDRERQWFKSKIGVDVCETARSLAFCSHAIALDDMLVVCDTRLDERFAHHPDVLDAPFVRFYAGQPVHSLDGQALGTLCIVDYAPRRFGEAERRMLRDLAAMVQDELNRDMIVAARDAAQRALREMNAQLELRVEERTRELRQKQELLDAVLESVDVGVVACGADGALTLFNRAARELCGVAADVDALARRTIDYQLFAEDGGAPLDAGRTPLLRALHGEKVVDIPMVIQPTGGRARRVLSSGRALKGTDGVALGAVVALKDVTELHASRARVIESEEWLRTIADNVPALIAYVDTGMRYRFANQRYQEWFGVRIDAMLGKTVRDAMGDAFFAPRQAALERCLAGHAAHVEIEEERRGRKRVISSCYLPHLREGRVQGVYVLSTDATSAREYERQLHALAHSDHLTGLPNRRSYEERLTQAVARARRGAQALALAYLDIDRFKQINDTFGHALGDAVLREFGRRILETVRAGDTVARLAGDEFVIVLEQVGSPLECERIAAKLLDAIRPPFQVQGQTLPITASIGIAWSAYPDQGTLAHGADDALYRSKGAGRDAASVVVAGT